MDEEGLSDTANQLIHIGRPIDFDEKRFLAQLQRLKEEAGKDSGRIREAVKEMVPTYAVGSRCL